MKNTKLVIVPTGMSILGVFTSGKAYDIIDVEVRPRSARAYYTSDSGREEYAVFDLDCVKDGMIKDGAKSPAEIWEVREVEIESPLSEIDQIIATAQHYAEETAKRAISDALQPGGSINSAINDGWSCSAKFKSSYDPVFTIGQMFIGDAIIRPGEIKFAPTEDVENADGRLLDELRDILRVPEGESIIDHARALRQMADALTKIANQ